CARAGGGYFDSVYTLDVW
nr:immunoglobulin heavy chain junction region [Macaca mulatta]MOW32245.1 immunoglobulin heavy chain junction region [Macaca mulatta]MOW32254.1 immunoglobulin heavy chain junction region [Macaca mulatta]MOW32329.1 immunoglobulin heavy chain junction region [Macaca mulatta]MOW32388.1 immunoglobulin heavy chain junction region [Macaca mulatta]